jgi:hypothetical protein
VCANALCLVNLSYVVNRGLVGCRLHGPVPSRLPGWVLAAVVLLELVPASMHLNMHPYSCVTSTASVS